MRRIMNILRSSKGETLMEVVVSMVLVALALTIFTGCIMTASKINALAERTDKDSYEEVTAAELRAEPEGDGPTETEIHVKLKVEDALGLPGYIGTNVKLHYKDSKSKLATFSLEP